MDSLKNETVRPQTTLFMLMSLDGKISTGTGDKLDFDTDLWKFKETADGLQQYYDIEQTTNEWCLCTGKTKEKIGINDIQNIKKIDCNIVILDNKHLTALGVRNLTEQYKKVVLFTNNRKHPVFNYRYGNLDIEFMDVIKPKEVMELLYSKYGVEYLTVQSGSQTNGMFFKNHLIDYVDLVVAPLIVGGENTPTLVGGYSFKEVAELKDLGFLQLISCKPLKDNYIRLFYKVTNSC